MKKNNQMKPDNVAKRLWAFFIVLTMCITVQPVVPVYVLRFGPYAIIPHEPCQAGNRAALSDTDNVP